MEEILTLWSNGLLSKWGFNDGDTPNEVYELLYKEDIDWQDVDWRDEVLPLLVEKYVVPLLDQKVEIYRIYTAHNPIRAASVQEEIVTDSVIYGSEPLPAVHLTPELVEIPMDVVLDEIRSTMKES